MNNHLSQQELIAQTILGKGSNRFNKSRKEFVESNEFSVSQFHSKRLTTMFTGRATPIGNHYQTGGARSGAIIVRRAQSDLWFLPEPVTFCLISGA
jgi:hypothetical protein